MLEVALISWAMQRVAAAGFTLHGTPDLVRAAVLEKCGFQPRGDNTQVHLPSPPPHPAPAHQMRFCRVLRACRRRPRPIAAKICTALKVSELSAQHLQQVDITPLWMAPTKFWLQVPGVRHLCIRYQRSKMLCHVAKACFAFRDADILPFGSPMFASNAYC